MAPLVFNRADVALNLVQNELNTNYQSDASSSWINHASKKNKFLSLIGPSAAASNFLSLSPFAFKLIPKPHNGLACPPGLIQDDGFILETFINTFKILNI